MALLVACGGDDDAPAPAAETPTPTAAPPAKVAFKLKEENGSGKSGHATLRGGDDGFTVNRALKDFDAQLETVDAPLPDLEGGRSRSQEDAELSAYLTGGFSVNVHSTEGGFPVVACGDIPAQQP